MSYQPRIAIHPGEVLSDILKSEQHNQTWLADRTGYSDKQISQVIHGKAVITPGLALRLERVLDASADFWNNLTANYLSDLARLEEQARAEAESRQYMDALENTYHELVRCQYIESISSRAERIRAFWTFFGVNSIADIKMTQSVAFRESQKCKQDPYVVAAWLRCGEIKKKQLTITAPFSKAAVEDAIIEIKKMIPSHSSDFFSQVQDILKQAGVALVAVKYFKKSYINGATRWDGRTPVIQLSDRGKCDDQIWFTLFHELGHILLHGKRDQFITSKWQLTDEKEEYAANQFASDTLIDPVAYDSFVQSPGAEISREQIIAFANTQNTASSIVLGRLQHDHLVPYHKYPGLRRGMTAI